MVRQPFGDYEEALQVAEKFRKEHTKTTRANPKLSPTDLADLQTALKMLQKSSDLMNDHALRGSSFHCYLTSKAIRSLKLLHSLNDQHNVDENTVGVITHSPSWTE